MKRHVTSLNDDRVNIVFDTRSHVIDIKVNTPNGVIVESMSYEALSDIVTLIEDMRDDV